MDFSSLSTRTDPHADRSEALLPLKLVYLFQLSHSASPHIHEFTKCWTIDGGLHHLARILQISVSVHHGLKPCLPLRPTMIQPRPLKLVLTLNPQPFCKHATYKISLTFQCIVNIGVGKSRKIHTSWDA